MTSSRSSSPSSSSVTSSMSSSELQAEFLQERRNKFQFLCDFDDSSVSSSVTPPSSPDPSPSSPLSPSTYNDDRNAYMSLSSPKLLSELKRSGTGSLRHVRPRSGLTTIYSGQGRGGLVTRNSSRVQTRGDGVK